MKKKPVPNTRTGKSNTVLRNFLSNLKENELHYENKQITQCVFLGVLRLKPVPSIFSSTSVPSNGPSVVRSKPRKAKNNNSNKEVNKNVSKKTSINKIIDGKVTKKNTDKVKECIMKSPAKKSKIIKIELNINKNRNKFSMPNNDSELTVTSKSIPETPITKQTANQNSKSTIFNPVDSLLNKLKQKIDVCSHSSEFGMNYIDSSRRTQTEYHPTIRRKLIVPTKSKLLPEPIHQQPFTMSLSSNSLIVSDEHLNKEKDDVIFVSDYKLRDPTLKNNSSDDIIFIDGSKTGKQKERTSPRSKISNFQDSGFNRATVTNNTSNDPVTSHNVDIIIIGDESKSRPSTPNDLIVVDDPREIRVSPRLKKSVDQSYSNNYVSSKNKIVVLSNQDLNQPESSSKKCTNQQVHTMINNNEIVAPVKDPMHLLQTEKSKGPEESCNLQTVHESIVQKPIEKPKQRRSRLMAAAIPSIFLNTPMLLRSELAQKKTTTATKPKSKEKSHPRLLRSELLSKSFSEQKVQDQNRIGMRKCISQENLFVPEESKTVNAIEQKKRSNSLIKNTSHDRWEITKSTPTVEIKNQEMKPHEKPVSLKLTLTKTSKTNSLPMPKEKTSKNQETQTDKNEFVIESLNLDESVKLQKPVLNLVDVDVAKNTSRLLISDINQKSPNSDKTNTNLLEKVVQNSENMEVIVIDDKKNYDKCCEDKSQISPRLLRSNITQQTIQSEKDTVVTSNISKVKDPEVILISDEINLENKSNTVQPSRTNDSYRMMIPEKTSKIVYCEKSVINQSTTNLIKQQIRKSPPKSGPCSNQSGENTTFMTTQQTSVSACSSTSPRKLKQFSTPFQESVTPLPTLQSCVQSHNSTNPQNSKQSSRSSDIPTLITTQQSPCNSSCSEQSEQPLTQSQTSTTLNTSQQGSVLELPTKLHMSDKSPTRSQANLVTIQQRTASSHDSPQKLKTSPIKNRSMQKKVPINFDEIIVLNEKRTKKSKEFPCRLLRSDFHQPVIPKLSKTIKREKVVVLIHEEPKSKCLPSPPLSKINIEPNSSSICHNNNVDMKGNVDASLLTHQKNNLVSETVTKNEFISLADSTVNIIPENNNKRMSECKLENDEHIKSTVPKHSKPKNIMNENVDLDPDKPSRNLRSQKGDKSEDVNETKNTIEQTCKFKKDNKIANGESVPQRINLDKSEKVGKVLGQTLLRSNSEKAQVETLQKLPQRILRSKKHDVSRAPIITSLKDHRHEKKPQCLNESLPNLPTRMLRSQKVAEKDVNDSKNQKKRGRKKKSDKLTSMLMVKKNVLRSSKALVNKKVALRRLRKKIPTTKMESSKESLPNPDKTKTGNSNVTDKNTRRNGNIPSTVAGIKNSDKIKSRFRDSKKRKCIYKFLPTKKVLRRKCKLSNKLIINKKPKLAVKLNSRVKRKSLNNTVTPNLLVSQKVARTSTDKKVNFKIKTASKVVKQIKGKVSKSIPTHKGTEVRRKLRKRESPEKVIKKNSTSKSNHCKVEASLVKNNLGNRRLKDRVIKDLNNQRVNVGKYKVTESIHKKPKQIDVKEDKSLENNVVDDCIIKRKNDEFRSENAVPKKLCKNNSKTLENTRTTVVPEGRVQEAVGSVESGNTDPSCEKAVPKRQRNKKAALKETTLKSQTSNLTEILSKCADCNKTILRNPHDKDSSKIDDNKPTVTVVAQQDVTTENVDKNRDITVFDFNETELEPVPPMRFNSPKKDNSLKPTKEQNVSEICKKPKTRRLTLTESKAHQETQSMQIVADVTKKKLYSTIEKPVKPVVNVKTRVPVIDAEITNENIILEGITTNNKSKKRPTTKEEATSSIKLEPKIYSVIEKNPKQSQTIEATNIPVGIEESSPVPKSNVDTKTSPKKSPMKQTTITDMFNKMRLKKDQSSATRSVFSPPPTRKEPTTVVNDTSKESQSSPTTMSPPKIEKSCNKPADVEDEDSDCESRMEWIPEEYAEYKFKYTAKKLMNNKPIFQCKFCLLTMPSYYFLSKHKLKHLESDKPYECQQCEEAFSDVVEYTAHIRVHKGKHPYTCKKCGEGFWTKNAYDAHMPVHILKKVKPLEKKYRCDVCGKTFCKLCDIERHTRVHTGEKPCVCNICNKRFQQSHNLSKHLLIHLDIKPFVCEICNKQFHRLDILDRHILTHSVKKPAMCQHCPKGFIRRSQLDVHMKKYHPDVDKNIKQESVPAK